MTKQLKILNILNLIVPFGLIIIISLIFFLKKENIMIITYDTGTAVMLKSFSFIMCIALIPLSFYYFKKQIEKNPDSNFDIFKKSKIIQFVLLELSGWFAIIAYSTDYKNDSLILLLIVLISFFFARPFYSQKDESNSENEINSNNDNHLSEL